MPGQFHLSVDELVSECSELHALGVPAVILFGLPAYKDEAAAEAYAEDGIVQLGAAGRARGGARHDPDHRRLSLSVHVPRPLRRALDGQVDNDVTLELLAQMAVSHALAGADVVAPSDMMDGRVARDPRRPRRRGAVRHGDPGLQREVRVRLLRPVPRRRPLRAAGGRPPWLPDGSGQRAGGAARGRAGRRRGRGHGDGEAGACRTWTCCGGCAKQTQVPDRRLPGERRVRDDRGRRGARA